MVKKFFEETYLWVAAIILGIAWLIWERNNHEFDGYGD